MREAIIAKPKVMEIREVPEVTRTPGYAIINVEFCGVCGSELHVYLGKHPKVKPPTAFAPGHEASGIIVDISEGNHDFKIGDKVAIVPLVGCQECVYCQNGYPNLCVNRRVIGFQMPGCFADKVAVPIENLVRLPEGCDAIDGALLEPMAVVVHSVALLNQVPYKASQAIITGAGTIGLAIALYLKQFHNMTVHIVEVNKQRKKLAEKLGLQVHESVQDISLGGMRPVIFECTGNKAVLNSIITCDPAPEVLVILGTFDRSEEVNLFELCKREIMVIGSQMYVKSDVEKAAQIMSSPFKNELRKIVSDKLFSLDEIQEAFEEALGGVKGTKVLVKVKKG
ncbi:zinc-dependent alcohol dehydrogenase [Sporomusa acidovorans]|uniref:2-dehydro-3-deoxy-L-rhamnonate dehydrogenase (NAD(+)) n=1 Tax=Sporomusa acidovorans (strain ATCC 49682 / DSM 3132 / Mol) TaxID=1123286 RepID=A0ABZ3J8X2_SPOA4|nr:alcohol dehydrogenase catalytic domain-containing protein [Sporomusa acidovorans]OZC21268.1 putative L-galactonate oxidoreductase [Sporomusa acidovorans DSM 3132]SDE66503.1 2-desacetyl-2-hydroxyethyl bacteriochlorophyllide A dehydrogenase [Sporomusa acidovorans]